MTIRLMLFDWIEKTFNKLEPNGLINFSEMNTEKIDRYENLCEIKEITISIGMKNVPETYALEATHLKWKKEIESLVNLTKNDRLSFEMDNSQRSVTSDKIDIAKGVPANKLLKKNSFLLTIKLFKKKIN